jgi:hypothetical protein
MDASDMQKYEVLAEFFRRYVFRWANSPMAELNSDVNRNRYMTLLVPPGDEIWLNYLYPLDSVSTTDSILKKLHGDVSETLTNEANTPVANVIFKNSISVAKFRDELALQAIESIFSFVGNNTNNLKPVINGNFSFRHRFLFDEPGEDALLSREFKLSKKPILAVLFSRVMVHRASLPKNSQAAPPMWACSPLVKSWPNNVNRRTILYAYQEDATVYHALSRLMLILNNEFHASKVTQHVWSSVEREILALKNSQ